MDSQSNSIARVATCSLNQWAMDFDTNKQNIIESIKRAKAEKCTIRAGPQLEISGYNCQDHFLESDTVTHSWQVLGEILDSDLTDDIICDIGMPIIFSSCLYNCRVICLNRKIILIKPQTYLADGDNYREPRWFTAWKQTSGNSSSKSTSSDSGKNSHIEVLDGNNMLEELVLPDFIQKITNQKFVPFGNAIIQTLDTKIGIEICQELWMPFALSTLLSFNGAEIFLNGNGSYHQVGKQRRRLQLVSEAMMKCGGVYLYSNLRGCDGNRVYFDGSSMVVVNGKIVNHTESLNLNDIDVLVSNVDLESVRSYRNSMKEWALQSNQYETMPRVKVDFQVCRIHYSSQSNNQALSFAEIESKLISEITWGPSLYLWDYLRRSGAGGFFLPLSGGADSASVALVVYNMCRIVYTEAIQKQNQDILRQIREIVEVKDFIPKSPNDICQRVLFTSYMGSQNSSQQTNNRSKELSQEIGSTHTSVSISEIFEVFKKVATDTYGQEPQFKNEGGNLTEDLCLQNIQSRSRMVLAYLLAGLTPWKQERQRFILVLGSANLDEGLRGYFTQYDCSSADINPIGSFSKADVNSFLQWNIEYFNLKSVRGILQAQPTAELRPLSKDDKIVQTDEEDMKMTYDELEQYGRLRKIDQLGPVSMFQRLTSIWGHKLTPVEIASKVRDFFFYYAINRHKMTTITPAYHVEPYGIDDNRFDLRQFLYNPKWLHQFQQIDEEVKKIEKIQNMK